MSLRVAGVGVYVPRLFLPADARREAWGTGGPRGIDRTAIPDADEDVVTMGTEAARRALSASEVDADAIERLVVATTTPPNDEEALAPRVASLVGCTPTRSRQHGGGTEAGVDALVTAFEASAPTLVVVADAPRGRPESDEEAAAGAGAGAVVLTSDGETDAGVSLDATGAASTAAPGTRFRRRGRTDTESIGITTYEREQYVRTMVGAVDALGTSVEAVDAAALTAPDGRLPYRLSGATTLSTEQIAAGTVVATVGDTGAAGPFLGLASALDGGAASVLLVGYGGGATATAALLSGSCPVDAALGGDVELGYAEALRRRGTITGTEPDGGGAYVSVPSWTRSLPQRHRLVAGRCRDCGELAFPPDGACRACGSFAGYDDEPLSGRGTVEATTVIGQGGAPPEFAEQQQRSGAFGVCVVAFDGPDEQTVSAPAQVATTPGDAPDIGDRIVTVPRRIYEQEGVVRYGLKVVPASHRR
jgi:hydroxymethylglutaryl-CoA synthase